MLGNGQKNKLSVMNMRNKIWAYISNRYENDGVLVDSDEVYTAYQLDFDNGHSSDEIDEVMEDFVGCSDLTGVTIEWEGENN